MLRIFLNTAACTVMGIGVASASCVTTSQNASNRSWTDFYNGCRYPVTVTYKPADGRSNSSTFICAGRTGTMDTGKGGGGITVVAEEEEYQHKRCRLRVN
jgi:hypothetical protein